VAELLAGETNPSFHDGSFDGVWLPGDKTVYFFVRTLNNKRFTIVLHDVVSMKLDDVRQGNIIFDITLTDTDQLTADHLLSVHVVSDVKRDEQIARLLESARTKKLKMVEMSTSYGAEGGALCRSAHIWEGTFMNLPSSDR
jgi:hypothetical protein